MPKLEVSEFHFEDISAQHLKDEFSERDFSSDSENHDLIAGLKAENTKSGFHVEDEVLRLSGLVEIEEKNKREEVEKAIRIEVEKIKESAFEKGFNAGRDAGKDEYLKEVEEVKKEASLQVQQFIDDFLELRDQVAESYKNAVVEIVNSLSKWAILKETSLSSYLPELLEKMIVEMNSSQNLRIHVPHEQLSIAEDIIKYVENRVGKLKNISIESLPESESMGVVVECDDCVFDASFSSQAKLIDKIFESLKDTNHDTTR